MMSPARAVHHVQNLRLWSGAFKDLLAAPPGKVIELATIPRSNPSSSPDGDGGSTGEGSGSRAFLQAGPSLGPVSVCGSWSQAYIYPGSLSEEKIRGLPVMRLSGPFTEDAVEGFRGIIYPVAAFEPSLELTMANVLGVTRLAFALRAPGVLTRCERLVSEKLDVARGHDRDSDHYLLPWLEVCDAIGRGFVIFSPYAHAYIIRSRFL